MLLILQSHPGVLASQLPAQRWHLRGQEGAASAALPSSPLLACRCLQTRLDCRPVRPLSYKKQNNMKPLGSRLLCRYRAWAGGQGPGPRGPASSPRRQGCWPPGCVMSLSCPAGRPRAPRGVATLGADSPTLLPGRCAGARHRKVRCGQWPRGRHSWSLGTQLVMERLHGSDDWQGVGAGAEGALGERLCLDVAGWPQAGHPDCTGR